MDTSLRYYQQTGASYRALCPERSGHMNMGYWPADSLRSAQEALVRDVISECARRTPGLRTVLDAGSGWGGSGRMFAERLAGVEYVGVNLSAEQISAAEQSTRDLPNVRYVQGEIGAYTRAMNPVDAVVSIEAAFHFENKTELLRTLRPKTRSLTMLEICVENAAVVERNMLLRAALGHAWSLDRYLTTLHEEGYRDIEVHDVSAQTFAGFARYLRTWDQIGYDGSVAIARQFRSAFSQLEKLAEAGLMRYVRLSAATQ